MINSSAVGTLNTVIYTSAGNSAVTLVLLTNVGVLSDYVDLYAVDSASGSPSPTNKILSNLLLMKDDTYAFNMEKFIMGVGDKLVAISEKGTTVATVSCMSLD